MNKIISTILIMFFSKTYSYAVDFNIKIDSAFTQLLMPSSGGGITGADGTISIDLKDGRNLFMWGDSFIGDVEKDKRDNNSKFIMGNTFTILNKDGSIKTFYSGNKSSPSAFIQAEQTDVPCWYWPGDGFVNNGILHLFMSKFKKTGNNMFDFTYVDCDYFRLDIRTMKVIDKTNFQAASQSLIHYGHAIYTNKNNIYIYGTKVNKNSHADLYIAKAQLINNTLTNFQFWDGKSWQSNPQKAKRIEGINQSISEQFSVFSLRDKIILVSQSRFGNTKDIYSYISKSPEGPFYGERKLYTVNEKDFDRDNMITYNAMVHPQYRKGNKILVCYNVNTLNIQKVFEKASLYQPRFFWLSIDSFF